MVCVIGGEREREREGGERGGGRGGRGGREGEGGGAITCTGCAVSSRTNVLYRINM